MCWSLNRVDTCSARCCLRFQSCVCVWTVWKATLKVGFDNQLLKPLHCPDSYEHVRMVYSIIQYIPSYM